MSEPKYGPAAFCDSEFCSNPDPHPIHHTAAAPTEQATQPAEVDTEDIITNHHCSGGGHLVGCNGPEGDYCLIITLADEIERLRATQPADLADARLADIEKLRALIGEAVDLCDELIRHHVPAERFALTSVRAVLLGEASIACEHAAIGLCDECYQREESR